MYVEKEKIDPAYVSNDNTNREKQIILLMISNGEKLLHYVTGKKTISIIIVLIAFILLQEKKKLESHKKVCKNKDFCNVIMLSDDTKILDLSNIENLIKHHLLFMQILNE